MAHSHGDVDTGDRRIGWAVAVNVALTFAQIAGGILSGSLSLIADAIHNFSDAASLGIAFVARRISRRPADDRMTFGYARAEIVAVLINYRTLIVIGLYLVYEAVMRFITPEPIEGWLVVWIAGIALVIDTVTAVLVYSMSRSSMNIRAAFLHNIADALGSIGVILGGTAIIVFGWLWIDPAITLMIAGYILWQAFREIGGSIRILMQGAPEGVDAMQIRNDIEHLDGVVAVTHFHIWSIDEDHASVEAHVACTPSKDGDPALLISIRKVLREQHGIRHSTIELRPAETAAGDENNTRIH